MAFVTVYQGAGGRIDLEYTYTQSIPNNTTSLTVKAYVVKTNSSYYSYNNGVNFRLTVAGSNTNRNWSFNFSNMTLNTRYLITSTTRTLSHNSNGTHGNVSLSVYSATNTSGLGTISGSTSISIPTIPRASSLNSFSFANSLQIGTPVTINLSISRNSSSFTHDIQLRDGSTVLQSWNGQGVPTSLTVSASTVNTMLNRMSTVTSKTFTLRVQTKSGSSNVGSAVTRTATVSVHSSVTPTASGLNVSVYGSGRDKSINKFVQNISRVTASFTGTARGGATVSSRKIVIRRVSDGSNSQTINSGSGTTSGKVTLSGTYEAIATVTDSRGRSATQRVTFTVHAYSPPKITSFTAVRISSTPTTVDIGRYGSWSALGGDNPLTIVIKRGSTTIQNATETSGTVSGTLVDTGRSVTSSYKYTLTLTDTFGNSANASATVSTDKVVLDIHKNEGVGIGKIHERGALDVGGDTVFNGIINHVSGGANRQTNMGSYYSASSSNTGVIRITVPNRNIMFNAKVTLRSYNYMAVLYLGGYTYTSSSNWHMPQATGQTHGGALNVRFSGSGESRYIQIGDTDTNWGGYLHVSVDEVTSGYGQTFPSPFDITLATSYIGSTSSTQSVGGSIAWGNITGKPSTFPPSSHNHSGADITSGTIPYARLPVGTGSSQVARGNHTHSEYVVAGGSGGVHITLTELGVVFRRTAGGPVIGQLLF